MSCVYIDIYIDKYGRCLKPLFGSFSRHNGWKPQWFNGKQSTCRRHESDPWVGPWKRRWQPTPVFLPGEFRGQRSLVGYSPKGLEELDTTERLSVHIVIIIPCIEIFVHSARL